MTRSLLLRAIGATVLGATTLAAVGCTEPVRLTHDFSRAYTEAFGGQSDLTRTSVANSAHAMDGREAYAIRLRSLEASSNTETEQSTLSATGG